MCYMHVTRYIGVWGLHKDMNTGDRNNWDTVEPVTNGYNYNINKCNRIYA